MRELNWIGERLGAILLVAIFSARALAADEPPTSLPASAPMSRDLLDRIYRTELGSLYQSADAPKLYQANQLIEQYFTAPAQRRQIVQSLESLGLDANIIGRLTRIRMDWPELAPGVYYINERVGPHDVRYFLGVPTGYDRTRAWPLVIELPTADAFVSDPRPSPQRVTQIYTGWMSQELTAHPDAVLIMPLLNLDELWGPSYAGMNNVIQPMLHAAGRANIDPARVYLVGHAMSAHAVWNLALHYPTYFAAFDALAGGASAEWQRVRLMNLRNVLPVVWQDADDPEMKVDETRQLVRALRDLKVNVDYLETKNIGHVPTPQIAEQEYRKMREHARELYPARVTIQSTRADTMFNRSDWVQMYQAANPGPERRMILGRGTGLMLTYSTPDSIDATIDNKNTITIVSRNVESMRFYLNDRMIDFTKPVTLIINRRQRFSGIIKPSIDEMLKDQLFLGRGWRYYSGIIDFDFTDAPASASPTTRGTTTRPGATSGNSSTPIR